MTNKELKDQIWKRYGSFELSHDKNVLIVENIYEFVLKQQEETAIEFAEFIAKYPNKNKNYLGEILHAKSKYDDFETTKGLFQEFIKTKQ